MQGPIREGAKRVRQAVASGAAMVVGALVATAIVLAVVGRPSDVAVSPAPGEYWTEGRLPPPNPAVPPVPSLSPLELPTPSGRPPR